MTSNPLMTSQELSRVLTISFQTWLLDNLAVRCLMFFPSHTGLLWCWPPCSCASMSQCGGSPCCCFYLGCSSWALHEAVLVCPFSQSLLLPPSPGSHPSRLSTPYPAWSSVTHFYLTLCFLLLLPVSLKRHEGWGWGGSMSSLFQLLLLIRHSQCLNNVAESRHWMDEVTGSLHCIWSKLLHL